MTRFETFVPYQWNLCGRQFRAYSGSPKNPALQLLQKSSKSASTTPQRPFWNSFGTVRVRDFWEKGCTSLSGRLAFVWHLWLNHVRVVGRENNRDMPTRFSSVENDLLHLALIHNEQWPASAPL